MMRQQSRPGFTLVELLVVVAVIVVLLALLLPAIGIARASSRTAQCATHLKELGDTFQKANQNLAGKITASTVEVHLNRYLSSSKDVWNCPDRTPSEGASYGWSKRLNRLHVSDARKVAALDYASPSVDVVGTDKIDNNSWQQDVGDRHFGLANVLFFDGHLEKLDPFDADGIDPNSCRTQVKRWIPTVDLAVLGSGCEDWIGTSGRMPGDPQYGIPDPNSGGGPGGNNGPPTVPCPELSGQPIDISISPAEASANEGATGEITQIQFTVSLGAAAAAEVIVQVQTVDDTATSGDDYTAIDQELTFAPGETTKTVVVDVLGDDEHEPVEYFRLELRNPTYDNQYCEEFTVGSSSTGAIYNDDAYDTDEEEEESDPCEDSGNPLELDKGLQWIARHQMGDGRWNFDHTLAPGCDPAECTGAGSIGTQMTNASTGLAMLPLIGSGSSPVKGPYRVHLCKAVNYLMTVQEDDGSLAEDAPAIGGQMWMYTHLVAHLALAEALFSINEADAGGCADYGEGSDCELVKEDLENAVQKALDYTISSRIPYDGTPPPVDNRYELHPYSFDPWWTYWTYYGGMHINTGGWRYCAGAPPGCWDMDYCGDVSHHGWGVAALKATELAGVSVPQEEFEIADYFLWAHQSEPVTDPGYGTTIGKRYGYMQNWLVSDRMTSIGLLCRAMLGHPTSHPAFAEFADGSYAPQENEMYYNFHATQIMYRIGGDAWTDWNSNMQNLLMPHQATDADGHAEGSWHFSGGDHGANGFAGRLYGTTMALLSLEAYFSGLKLGGEN